MNQALYRMTKEDKKDHLRQGLFDRKPNKWRADKFVGNNHIMVKNQSTGRFISLLAG
jgi:hypothetical protein